MLCLGGASLVNDGKRANCGCDHGGGIAATCFHLLILRESHIWG
jgi:hypothetical protein